MAHKEDKNRPTNESRRRWFKEIVKTALVIGGATELLFISAQTVDAQADSAETDESSIVAQAKPQGAIPSQPGNPENPNNIAPDKIGDFLTEGVEVNNLGKNYRILLNNPDQYQVKILNYANKYFPQGVKYFIYDRGLDDMFNNILVPLVNNPKYNARWRDNVQWNGLNPAYQNNIIYSGVNLENGALEVHMGLPLPNNQPDLAEERIDVSISDYMSQVISLSAGGPYNDDPEDRAWRNYKYDDSRKNPIFVMTSTLASVPPTN